MYKETVVCLLIIRNTYDMQCGKNAEFSALSLAECDDTTKFYRVKTDWKNKSGPLFFTFGR